MRPLNLRYLSTLNLSALALIGILTTGAYFGTIYFLSERQSDAAIINFAGRQRMLSQKLVLYTYVSAHKTHLAERDDFQEMISDTTSEWVPAHKSLENMGHKLGLSGKYLERDRLLRSELEPYFQGILEWTIEVHSLDAAQTNVERHELIFRRGTEALAPGYLKYMNLVVANYQAHVEHKFDNLKIIGFSIMLGVSLLFLAIGVFIYRPILKHVKSSYEQAQQARARLERELNNVQEAKEAVKTSEAWKASILDSTSEGIVTMDEEGRITEINPPVEKIFGYGASEAVGERVSELFIPAELREQHEAGLRKFLATGESLFLGKRFETKAIRKDGSEIFIEMIVNARIFNGRYYFTAFIRDITDSKKAEKELSRFKATLDQTLDCIFIFDPDTLKFTYVNKGAEEQVGYSAMQLADMTSFDIKPLFDEAQFREKIRPLVDGECESILFETLHRHKKGDDIPVEINLQYISPSGEEPRFVAIVRDISERKKADAALERLVRAVEQVAESVMITDLEGNITYVNSGFETVTGYTRGEALGQNPRMLSSGKQSNKFYQNLWNTIHAGRVWRGELVNKKKDGTFYEEVGTISPVIDSDGTKTGYISVKRDVTEERGKEARLQQAQKMESIAVFTSGIAHDFNNILTPILGYTDLLSNRLLDDPRSKNDLDAINTAGMRAKDLISQILLFSRQKGTAQVPVRLTSIVKEAIKMLRSAMPATIEIRYNVDPDLSLANADITQIHTLLMNLATNASYAMPDGGELKIELEDAALDDFEISNGSKLTGKFVHLSVADNGAGMDETTLSRIFEPFFTTKEIGSGTGLGLSTVFGIAEQHNGHISVQSTVGEGTTFDFYLPALEDQTEKQPEEQQAVDVRGKESIMFIDDEAAIVRSSSIALQMLGYDVSAFTSSKEALETLWEDPSKFDLIITDQTMPFMTGSKLAAFVRGVRCDLPIVIASGNQIDFPEDELDALGVKSILAKPYRPKELARVIRNVLDEARQ